MSSVGLIVPDLSTRGVRTALTALAVAISVMAVVTSGVVTQSLKNSAADCTSGPGCRRAEIFSFLGPLLLVVFADLLGAATVFFDRRDLST